MKKTCMILVLTMMTAGGIFAQHEAPAAKNWISGQASLLGFGVQGFLTRESWSPEAGTMTISGVGVQYERTLTPKFSVGGAAYFDTLFFVYNETGVKGIARFYPRQRVFFAEIGLGFSLKTLFFWGYIPLAGVLVEPGLGWKIDVGAPGGFFIEPFLSTTFVFGSY